MADKLSPHLDAYINVMVQNIESGLIEVLGESPTYEVLRDSVLAFIDSVSEDDFAKPLFVVEALIKYLESFSAKGQALQLQVQTVAVVAILCVMTEDSDAD